MSRNCWKISGVAAVLIFPAGKVYGITLFVKRGIVMECNADVLDSVSHIALPHLLDKDVLPAVEHLLERVRLVGRIPAEGEKPVFGIGGDRTSVFVE